ncbi:transcriptional regulator [Wenjunlia tyrosinilytica]|uniref:Transcriptional regulator n=1 Tax=Wenjunlia tyrosinilytica TaxID=1544741 RepID=A0A917ZJR7_9ACTN|nr:helix-turn-helix transcriptional regulator [Wenjunlia tyrosinilytica]GGO84011.1 transcriptional regulator [Wenjunlia tyrosinilytica]
MEPVPTVRRRKLGAELRRQRDKAGLTSEEAAHRVGWHQSKVSRIETGRSGARPADVRSLLDVYGVDDTGLRQALEELARDGAKRGWWQSYRDMLPPSYIDFISLESDAASMRTLEMSVVPGLLQTADYARAVTREVLPRRRCAEVDALVDVRIARQVVLGREPPLQLWAVIDEAALRREVGGPEVMRTQMLRLAQLAARPHVHIQVLPFSRGAHIGLTGPFVIFSFPNDRDQDVVSIDHLTSSLYLEQEEETAAYSSAFELLRSLALSTEDSLAYVADIAKVT